ncbi:MAG: hypothetical protein ABIH67_05415 [Candidatus Uhrbacteria bacterium]
MRILIFIEGTILMHKNAAGHTREEIVKQVVEEEESIRDYGSYIPVGGQSVQKIKAWKDQEAEIIYLTSRRKIEEIQAIQDVLTRNDFPKGDLVYRQGDEEYKNVAERIIPDILIEDDCESIGGVDEMTITHVAPEIRQNIHSIPVKEFGGIGHLPDNIMSLQRYEN